MNADFGCETWIRVGGVRWPAGPQKCEDAVGGWPFSRSPAYDSVAQAWPPLTLSTYVKRSPLCVMADTLLDWGAAEDPQPASAAAAASTAAHVPVARAGRIDAKR